MTPARILTTFLLLTATLPTFAGIAQDETYFPEEKVISFESKSHDFGDILLSDGPVECSFAFRNEAPFPIQIFNVVSSCGCTKPSWTTGEIAPGGKGSIKVTFTNDQGPYPFDKTLTVYVSNVSRPVLLHVRGVAREKMLPLAQRFPIHDTPLAFRQKASVPVNLPQGGWRSDVATIANISRKAVSVKAIPLADGITAEIEPEHIAPGKTALLKYSVDLRRNDVEIWGARTLPIGFEADGKMLGTRFGVKIFVYEDFASATQSEKDAGPVAECSRSYFEFGEVSAGTTVKASFQISNTGRSNLILRSLDCDDDGVSFTSRCPLSVKPGASCTVTAKVATVGRKGEIIDIIKVVTNSPAKPVLTLFITGNLK